MPREVNLRLIQAPNSAFRLRLSFGDSGTSCDARMLLHEDRVVHQTRLADDLVSRR